MQRRRRLFRALGSVTILGATLTTGAIGTRSVGADTAQVWVVADQVRCKSGVENDSDVRDVVARINIPILMPGDLAAPSGSISEFTTCFDPLWGAMKSRMKPAPGNHEYNTPGAAGYYEYFNSIAPYYAWNLNRWRIYSLNSMCGYHGGCGVGSPMYRWLENDLKSRAGTCQVAYWHHPRWSQGQGGNIAKMAPLYALLDRYEVELLFVGHENGVYERYAALDAKGVANGHGVTEVVVSTGGTLDGAGVVTANAPAPVVRGDGVQGALLLNLKPSSWSAQFRPGAGTNFTDSFSGTCF